MTRRGTTPSGQCRIGVDRQPRRQDLPSGASQRQHRQVNDLAASTSRKAQGSAEDITL